MSSIVKIKTCLICANHDGYFKKKCGVKILCDGMFCLNIYHKFKPQVGESLRHFKIAYSKNQNMALMAFRLPLLITCVFKYVLSFVRFAIFTSQQVQRS